MKKLIVLLIASLFSICLIYGQNKERVDLLKNAEKELNEEVKKEKTNDELLKNEKKELKSIEKQIDQLEGNVVSNEVKDVFFDDFGDIPDVIWEADRDYNVATFTSDGKTKRAYYNFDKQLIGSTWSAAFADLPENAQETINSRYKGYEIEEVVFYEDNELHDINFFIYDQEFSHEDSYFVELTKDSKHIALQVDSDGDVSFFKHLK